MVGVWGWLVHGGWVGVSIMIQWPKQSHYNSLFTSTQQFHISYAMKPVLPAPRLIRPTIDPTLEIIDTAATFTLSFTFTLFFRPFIQVLIWLRV